MVLKTTWPWRKLWTASFSKMGPSKQDCLDSQRPMFSTWSIRSTSLSLKPCISWRGKLTPLSLFSFSSSSKKWSSAVSRASLVTTTSSTSDATLVAVFLSGVASSWIIDIVMRPGLGSCLFYSLLVGLPSKVKGHVFQLTIFVLKGKNTCSHRETSETIQGWEEQLMPEPRGYLPG